MSTPSAPPETTTNEPRAAAVRAWRAPDFQASRSPRELLDELFGLRPTRWLRRMPGRATFAWPGRPDWIVKRTTGGEARDFWYERLRGLRATVRSAARREAESLARLRAAELDVPRPLAWVEEQRATRHPRALGRCGRSALVMERVPHVETLRERLGRCPAPERRALAEALLDFVARLHALGWYHRDLYLQHFVLSPDDEGSERLFLLDVGRARRQESPRRRWMVKDLAALAHSAPGPVSRAERLRFLSSWLARRGQDTRAVRRAWTRAVAAKARRLARHRPRAIDAERSTA